MLLGKLGKFEEAREIYEDVLEGYTLALGVDHPDTLDIVAMLAMLLKVIADHITHPFHNPTPLHSSFLHVVVLAINLGYALL